MSTRVSRTLHRSLAMLGLVSLAACAVACRGEQSLRDDCPSAGLACPACTADADCEIVSNTCSETASCTHRRREPPMSVTQLGCNWEYDRPPADQCGCVQGVCRSR